MILETITDPTRGALGFVLGGLACFFFRRRLPHGLGVSLFLFGMSVGIGLAASEHLWSSVGLLERICLAGSMLCALWALLGRLAAPKPFRDVEAPVPEVSGTFFAWSLVCGIVTVSVVVCTLAIATWPRFLEPAIPVQPKSREGVLVLAGLIAATLLWMRRTRHSYQPAMLLGLTGLLVWWTSLMIPSAPLHEEIPVGARLPLQPGWWTWTFQFQLGLTCVLVIAAVLQDVRYQHRRRNAWPDRLEDLVEPYARWRGYIQTEAVLAGIVLLIGAYRLIRFGPQGWQLQAANGLTSACCAAACLYMTYRRWSADTGGLGMALLTLSVASFSCALAAALFVRPHGVEYGNAMPVFANTILFALWFMIGLWCWLGRFWEQQLLDGVPWTTTGRMIPYAHRMGFLLAAIAVLVAYQMTFWPTRPMSAQADDSLPRIICGSVAMVCLFRRCSKEARLNQSTPFAVLATALLAGVVIFVFVRLPSSRARGWLIQYAPVVLSAAALAIGAVAGVLAKSKHRMLATPMRALALLFLPLLAMVELALLDRLPDAWLRPATLLVLGVVYLLAGRRKHRRACLLPASIFMAAAVIDLVRL